jgi:hypothetical protein
MVSLRYLATPMGLPSLPSVTITTPSIVISSPPHNAWRHCISGGIPSAFVASPAHRFDRSTRGRQPWSPPSTRALDESHREFVVAQEEVTRGDRSAQLDIERIRYHTAHASGHAHSKVGPVKQATLGHAE